MIFLALAVLLFDIFHPLTILPSLQMRLKHRFGERLYRAIFASVMVLSTLLIVFAWRAAPYVAVYQPLSGARYTTYILELLAAECLSIFLFRGRLRQALRFPMGFAVLCWGTGHLLSNGDLAGVILFAGLMVGVMIMIAVGLVTGYRPSPDVRAGHDGLSLLAGLGIFATLVQLHDVIAGVPVISLS